MIYDFIFLFSHLVVENNGYILYSFQNEYIYISVEVFLNVFFIEDQLLYKKELFLF